MSEPSEQRPGQGRSGQGQGRQGTGGSGDSWEQRAAGLASDLATDLQRRLIRSGAKSMRDELGGQVKKAFRGEKREPEDVWATATTEPPDASEQPPECAWCPICRAARRMAQSQAQAASGGAASSGTATASPSPSAGTDPRAAAAGAVNIIVGTARDALVGLDAILSYRPGDASSARSANGTSSSPPKEPDDEPDHRS